jgi:DHA3 family macrolide efflux protein-like MFS transporter
MSNWKRTFAFIWSGQMISALTSSITSFAIVFWLSSKSGSAEVLAYAMIATILPFSILGTFTGVYIDRLNRKKIMIYADLFIALCAGILAILFSLEAITYWEIYLLLALRSIGSAFHSPAMQASVPLIAPEDQLMRVAGVGQIIYSISNIAGPALGAALVVFLKMEHIMLLDIAGALFACSSLLFVKIPSIKKSEDFKPNIIREIKEGISHLFASRGLNILLISVIVVTFFMMPVVAMYPLMTLDHFNGDSYQMGIVEIAWGLGMLAGGAIANFKVLQTLNRTIIICFTTAVLGASFLLSGLLSAKQYELFVIITGLSGIAGSLFWSSFTVILQTKIDPSAMGRAFSIYDSISLLPSIPGLLATGYIAKYIGLLNAFIIAGGLTLMIGLIPLLSKSAIKVGKTK